MSNLFGYKVLHKRAQTKRTLSKRALYLLGGLTLGFTLMACQSTEQEEQAVNEVALTTCPETRPQICTMEYMPVCGSKSDASTKIYGNACGACGDVEVTGYVAGACEADDEK